MRKPDVNDNEYVEYIRQIPEKFHPKIVIHRAFNRLKDYNLGGVHLSSTNRPEKPESPDGKILSTSCHSFDEVETLPKEYTHCFLSPIFPSISKHDYGNILDRNELREFLEKERKVKVIGLGGVNHRRLHDFKGYFFDGFAVLGAAWGSNPEIEKNIENNFQKIYECVMSDHIV
ncbi:MAG: thiamine phosphate synthase [Chloroflexia bacterium]|nr:thiamine phosphate synthase [Chloroflexia bacterium]